MVRPHADAEAGLYPVPHRHFPVRNVLLMECACARRGIASPSAAHIGALETERNHDGIRRRLTAGEETLRTPHHQLMIDRPAFAPETAAAGRVVNVAIARSHIGKASHVWADRPLDAGNKYIAPAAANPLITARLGTRPEEIEPAPSFNFTNSNVNSGAAVTAREFIRRLVQRLALVAKAHVDAREPFVLQVGERPPADEHHDSLAVILGEFLMRPLPA